MDIKNLLIVDKQKVRNHFDKSERDVLKDIMIIKDWMRKQPHLPEIPNDNMIEGFLFTNKFSIEKVKKKLDMYYSIRSLIPELYKDKNPFLPHMLEMFNASYNCLLPKQTKELYRVMIIKLKPNSEIYDTYNFMAHQLNIQECRLHEDLAVGDVVIIDCAHLKMGHIMKTTPMHIKKGATVLQKVFSNRIKQIHVINYPPFVDLVLAIGKAVLKPKVFDRIHLHSCLETLDKYIPIELLPRDYGGKELSLEELNEWQKLKFEEYKDRFDKLDKFRVNEKLRPAPLCNDEVLGYHGCFKKLEVD